MAERTAATANDEEAEAIGHYLRARPEMLRDNPDLLRDLGLRVDLANIVDFGPAALARVSAAAKRESKARRALEANAQANFAAQAQTHAAVIDLLEARNQADLARRVDELARLRFGLVGAAVCLEGPARVPAGWHPLDEGQVDLALGAGKFARLGVVSKAKPLFGILASEVRSVAMIRLAIWEPARQGMLAFASHDPKGFAPDMGHELVDFLARVVERTAERWPVL